MPLAAPFTLQTMQALRGPLRPARERGEGGIRVTSCSVRYARSPEARLLPARGRMASGILRVVHRLVTGTNPEAAAPGGTFTSARPSASALSAAQDIDHRRTVPEGDAGASLSGGACGQCHQQGDNPARKDRAAKSCVQICCLPPPWRPLPPV